MRSAGFQNTSTWCVYCVVLASADPSSRFGLSCVLERCFRAKWSEGKQRSRVVLHMYCLLAVDGGELSGNSVVAAICQTVQSCLYGSCLGSFFVFCSGAFCASLMVSGRSSLGHALSHWRSGAPLLWRRYVNRCFCHILLGKGVSGLGQTNLLHEFYFE